MPGISESKLYLSCNFLCWTQRDGGQEKGETKTGEMVKVTFSREREGEEKERQKESIHLLKAISTIESPSEDLG